MNTPELDDDLQQWPKYRCHMHSAPGCWAQYEGYVDVFSPNDDEVFERAVMELSRTTFKDRPSLSSWRLDRIERLP